MNFKLIVLIHSFITFWLFTKAQKIPSPFITKTYTSQDGLPYNYVLAIGQGKNGYLWIGTSFGVCRFDGMSFSQVKINAGDNIIPHEIMELSDGRLWISTIEGKEVLYDGNKIIQLPDSLQAEANLPGFSPTEYRSWKHPGTHLPWLQTSEGWFINNLNKGYFVNTKGDSIEVERAKDPGYFLRFIGYSNKQLYYFTDKGLYKWSKGNLKALFEKELSNKKIYGCYYDSKKRFWVSTYNDGIYISTPGEENRLEYHLQLPNNLTSGFFEDNLGNMWIGSFEGLIKVHEKKYETFSKEQYPFLSDLCFISKDKKGVVYSFSEKNGFCSWSNGKFTYDPNNTLKGHLIDILCKDDQDRFWCITRRNKLLLFDHGKTKLINDSLLNSSQDLQWHIVYDEYRKKVWIPGDYLMLGDEKGFSIYKDNRNNSIEKPLALMKSDDEKIIVVLSSGDLVEISRDNKISKIITPPGFYPKKIYRFFPGSSGNTWISYIGTGLLQCSIRNDSLKILRKFTRETGLVNDLIQSIAFDKNGHLWLSTMAGIAILDLPKGRGQDIPVYLFGKNEGISPYGMEYGRLMCDNNGDMWFSTQNELLRFKPAEMKFNNSAPTVNIERVLLSNTETDWTKYTDSLQEIFRIPVKPVLRYKDNTLTFVFKAAIMNDAENVRYSYLLSGVNKQWSSNSKNNTVTFTHLDPGYYTFSVRARTNNYSWSVPAQFSFTILKPYWQQWWFITLIVVTGIGIIFIIYEIRIQQLLKEQEIRKQIAGDLHDDLGSTLNSVKVYTNLATLEKSNPSHLENIKVATQEAITGLRDIIWVLDDKKDTLDHLLFRVNQFAEPLCSAAHIHFNQSMDELSRKYKMRKKEKRNLYMILKESINNSIKYADCKNIQLNVSLNNRNLEIKISDDGLGFETNAVTWGNGLKNIQYRAASIGYAVTIISEKNQGTTIKLARK